MATSSNMHHFLFDFVIDKQRWIAASLHKPIINLPPLPFDSESPFALPPGVQVFFYYYSAVWIFFPLVSMKTGVRADVWQRQCVHCCLSSSFYCCCIQKKSFKVLLKCDTQSWEHAFCIWLRKLAQQHYAPVMTMNTCRLLCFLWQLRLYSWLLRWRRQENVWVRRYVSFSFHFFTPSEWIRFDKADFNINMIIGGLAAAKIFFSLQRLFI